MPANRDRLYTDSRLLPPRIEVRPEGGLESALKLFRAATQANIREVRRRTRFVGPSERRRMKSRLAKRRRRN